MSTAELTAISLLVTIAGLAVFYVVHVGLFRYDLKRLWDRKGDGE